MIEQAHLKACCCNSHPDQQYQREPAGGGATLKEWTHVSFSFKYSGVYKWLNWLNAVVKLVSMSIFVDPLILY